MARSSLTKITLRDVAAMAGLSAYAASMALRKHPRIREATKARVRSAADAPGYVPNSRVWLNLRESALRSLT